MDSPATSVVARRAVDDRRDQPTRMDNRVPEYVPGPRHSNHTKEARIAWLRRQHLRTSNDTPS